MPEGVVAALTSEEVGVVALVLEEVEAALTSEEVGVVV